MGLGRAKILRLCEQVGPLPKVPAEKRQRTNKWIREKPDATDYLLAQQDAAQAERLQDVEALFFRRVLDKGKCKIARNGWPDFFLFNETTGRFFAVEVKNRKDKVSAAQRRMFAMMERAGIDVFVWHPRQEADFVPWRKYGPPNE